MYAGKDKNIFVVINWLLIITGICIADASGDFSVNYADSMVKVRKEIEYSNSFPKAHQVSVDCARDESESFQLVLIPKDQAVKSLSIEIVEPANGESSLPVQWNIVGYVKTHPPKNHKASYVGWWPSPLLNPADFNLEKDAVQPLWFTVSVPLESKPGQYRGMVIIRSGNIEKSVELLVNVRSFSLPRPGTFAAPFGLYAPYISEYYFEDEDYTEHITPQEYARWCEFLGKHRITPKNIGYEYVKRTLGDEVLPPSGANIGRIFMSKDMSLPLNVDMSELKKIIFPNADKYYPPYSFGVYRLPPFEMFLENNDPKGKRAEEKEDVDLIVAPVKAHIEEWKRQGLPEDVFVYGVDEPRDFHIPFLADTYKKIKQLMPSVKIMQTISQGDPAKLEGLVDIWCPITPHYKRHEDFYRERIAKGDIVWLYVCCWPFQPYANFFIDEPAVNHRILFWQSRKAGATGFLYWSTAWFRGFNYDQEGFPDTPIDLINHHSYQKHISNGDGLLVYPGKDLTPLSSINLENIRDGIEDYEYLSLLERIANKLEVTDSENNYARLIARAHKIGMVPDYITKDLTEYTDDPRLINERRKKVADVIEELTQAIIDINCGI
jgi:hypothetical protein